MHDENQAFPRASSGDPEIDPAPLAEPSPEPPPEPATAGAPENAAPHGMSREAENRGLAIWLGALIAGGAAGFLLGMQELAALVAVAGLFVAAQASDLDPQWKSLYYLISWVVPAGGAILSLVVAYAILHAEVAVPFRGGVIALSLLGAAVSVLSVLRPFSNALCRLLFRGIAPSHTLRLAARIVLATLLLAVPGWFAFRTVSDMILSNPQALLERVSFGGELLGYTLLALASVGFMLRRDLRATLDRLGLHRVPAGHLALIALGVIALFGLNAGADWLERAFFPQLWKNDQQFNQALASGLRPAQVILLGLSAGIGEEITLRGALQPRLGLVMTSLLFASLHVQYSWFGIAVIFLLGLTLGTIRQKTSTTVAIVVHTIYDVLAVFSV